MIDCQWYFNFKHVNRIKNMHFILSPWPQKDQKKHKTLTINAIFYQHFS